AAMERALRVVSVQRGVDPRGLALVAFGGAGPLHACALADALGMTAVVVPPRAGALSAVGLLSAPRARELVRSRSTPGLRKGLAEEMRALGLEAAGLLDGQSRGPHQGPVELITGVDCRYRGQSHEVTVSDLAAFPEEHRRRNGYARADVPVEAVALRATARIASSLSLAHLPATRRHRVVGPEVIAEPDCTIWVPEGWTGEPAAGGTLVLTRGRRSSGR
ncbi:MAG: hydantoinase/oxoprolinase family protein, partial [Acidimicrobiia bacterium]